LQLRKDFQLFHLFRLAPFPDSLGGGKSILVSIITFDFSIMP